MLGLGMGSGSVMDPGVTSGSAGEVDAATRFQQQLSGQWNQRVVEQSASTSYNWEDSGGGDSNFFPFRSMEAEYNREEDMERSGYSSADTLSTAGGIPQDLDTALDLAQQETERKLSLLRPKDMGGLPLELLEELDRDYLALRQRVVRLLVMRNNDGGVEEGRSERENLFTDGLLKRAVGVSAGAEGTLPEQGRYKKESRPWLESTAAAREDEAYRERGGNESGPVTVTV